MSANQASLLEQMVPVFFMVGVLYFLLLRPQSKRLKLHEQFLQNLKRGDTVITNSGILGTIEGITEVFVTLEVAPDVRLRILKKQIASSQAQVLESSKK